MGWKAGNAFAGRVTQVTSNTLTCTSVLEDAHDYYLSELFSCVN